MKVSYSKYVLEPVHSLNAISSAIKREGALLKIDFLSGERGYADCFVWPELGDLPLKEQLEKLERREFTSITRCALIFAKMDGHFRSQKKNFFQDQPQPKSHFLFNDLLELSPTELEKLQRLGYTHVKIKLGRDIEKEGAKLKELFSNCSLKLRLDFNETLTPKQFDSFLISIVDLKEKIDFIEDPFPFHASDWKDFQQQGVKLACDRQAPLAFGIGESAAVLVLKPAVIPCFGVPRDGNQTCIVTSYLGHPLGQTAAAFAALQIDSSCQHVHGLHSHHAYQPTNFSRQFNWEGPLFVPPQGTGGGFDRELERLEWKDL